MEHNAKFDIFSGTVDKDVLWIEAVEGLGSAKRRMDEIAAKKPGAYFVFHAPTQEVVAATDTSR
jgi:hypothetical protein